MENSFAVITGASGGIDMEIARQLGAQGHDLLIASANDDIFEAQEELEDFGYRVDAVKANLGTYAGVANLYDQIKASQRQVDIIVINTGPGVSGSFTQTDIKEEISYINLNIVSLVHLTKLILEDMQKNDYGEILFNTNSAKEAVTNASRAFIEAFAESLRRELNETNITVSLLIQGSTGMEKMKGKVFPGSLFNKLQDIARKVLTITTREKTQEEKSEPDSSSHHH